MKNNLSIRVATPDDALLIQRLARVIWPVTYNDILEPDKLEYMLDLFYSPRALEKQMNEDHHKFIIVYDESEPVGFASYAFLGNDVFKLHKIYVLPAMQGRGIGKALIEYVICDLDTLHAKKLKLNVNRHNKAKHFYKSLGFKIISEEDVDIGNGYFMNDYVMEKELTN